MKKRLFSKDFTLVVIGQIISLFGNAILRFALPLYLLKATGSPALFGMVSAFSFLPTIVLSVLGGVLADRVNKRNIMVWLDFATAALIGVLCALFNAISIVPLFSVVLMLLYAISGTYQPAVQASIPVLVDKENILSANSIINLVNSLANLLGPSIGGFVYSVFGMKPILCVSIVCFIVSAVMEIFIKIPFIRKNDGLGVFAIVKTDLKESFKFIGEHKIFIKVSVIVALFSMVLSAMLIVGFPVLLVTILKTNDRLYGIAQSIIGLGGLVGGGMTAFVGKKFKAYRSHYLVFGCSFCVLLAALFMFLNIPSMVAYILVTAMCFCAMVFATIFLIQMLATAQLLTPNNLVGKVIACVTAVAMCAQPLGQAIYGVLFDKFTSHAWAILLGAAILSGILAVISRKAFKELKNI